MVMFSSIRHKVGMYLPALRSPSYRLYFSGQFISLLGTWMASIAQQWLLYPVLTDNKSILGLVSFVHLMPTTLFVLLGGVVADRVNRKRLMIILQAFFASLSALMFILVSTGSIRIWHVFLIAAIDGILFAFEMPARQSFMVTLVEKKDYPSALSLNAAIFNGARAIGPAVGGALIALMGVAPAYAFDAVTYVVAIGFLLVIRTGSITKRVNPSSIWTGLREGLSYVAQHKVVAALLGLLGIMTFTTWPIATLLPVYAYDIYGKGEVGFGLLQAFFGVGALVGALAFSKLFSVVKDKYSLILICVFLTVIDLAAVALVHSFEFMLLGQIVNGWAIVTLISTVNSLVQLSVPDAIRGRALSLYSLVLIGGMPPGALFASAGVAIAGARMTVFASAVLLAVMTAVLIASTRGKFRSKIAQMI